MLKKVPVIGSTIKYSKGTAVIKAIEAVPNRFGTTSTLLKLSNGDRISPWVCMGIKNEEKWIQRFLGLARYVSQWSKDPSTKTGTIIVSPENMIISLGYNGFPRGVQDDPADYDNRAIKYERIIHSEVNAIISARTNLSGCSLYCYPLMPCARCATQIIQTGISTVIFPYFEEAEVLNRFKESHEHAIDMFQDTNVKLICYEGELK